MPSITPGAINAGVASNDAAVNAFLQTLNEGDVVKFYTVLTGVSTELVLLTRVHYQA